MVVAIKHKRRHGFPIFGNWFVEDVGEHNAIIGVDNVIVVDTEGSNSPRAYNFL